MGTLLQLTGAIALTAILQLFVSVAPVVAVDGVTANTSALRLEVASRSTLEQISDGISNFEPPDNGGPASSQGSGTR